MSRNLNNQPSTSTFDRLARPRNLLLLGLLLLGLWLGRKGWRLYQVAQSLQQHQTTAETLLANGPANIDPQAAADLVANLRTDFTTAHNEIRIFTPLFPYFGWTPTVGPLLEATPHLLTMADAGSRAATLAANNLGPALTLLQSDSPQPPLPELVNLLATNQATLAQLEGELNIIVTARNQIDNTDDLPWRVMTLLQQFDQLLPLAQDGLALGQAAPHILGHDAPRTYLILAQNEDERRATGGFISGVGLITINNGDIISIDFQDANFVIDLTQPYEFPPQPYYDFMGLELFVFRDANFWPDFPTSANKAMELYAYTWQTETDGVIAIDQTFVQQLVCALGTVNIPDLNMTINCNNTLAQIRQAYAQAEEGENAYTVITERKSFMGPLAQALQDKLFADFASLDLLNLAQILHRTAEEHHLQLHFRDPQATIALDKTGWNNRLIAQPNQDTLAVIDSNMGFNKVNLLVNRALNYNVTLFPDGSGQANLAIQYTHTSPPRPDPCDQGLPTYTTGLTYEQLIDDCYWNYFRIYTPPNTQLLNASQHTAPGTAFLSGQPWAAPANSITNDPSGLHLITNFLLLRYGETVTTEYNYTLPPTIVTTNADNNHYRLTVHKQAGSAADPLQLTITLPPNTKLLNAIPTPTTITNNTIQYNLDLATDLTFDIIYQ
ncbi:MAG TPA: DUF4012 domain-containing protein [Anaerolineae bacterium]|nr:DUF4012 domain-containing protein [Anaerolineae bacterium]